MKRLLKVGMLVLLAASIGSCELFDNFHHKKPKKKKFRAEFITAMTPTDDVRDCAEPFGFFNNQEGEGMAIGFGDFTTRVTFCVNFETLEYKDAEGVWDFGDGDKIFYTGGGQILPSDNPEYDLMFMDPFEIIGGTGLFEGVTGSGMTNSYVHLFPEGGDQTDHIWEGEIVFP